MLLSTKYLGLELKNPLIASSAPQHSELSYLKRLEDSGVAAVVLPSLFQEQIEAEVEAEDLILSQAIYRGPESGNYFPTNGVGPYGVGPEQYLNLIRRASESLSIPVIASLNGASEKDWANYARLIEEAGAHAIELNTYFIPLDFTMDGREVEQHFLQIISSVKQAVQMPVSVKLLPFISSMGNFVNEMAQHGIDGVVLFNRLLQPDIDLLTLRLSSKLHLSSRQEMSLSMLWVSLLAQQKRNYSISASTGVKEADDVIKYILLGADTVMTTSALLQHGPEYVNVLISGLDKWVESRGYNSLSEMRGIMSGIWSSHEEKGGRRNYIQLLKRSFKMIV